MRAVPPAIPTGKTCFMHFSHSIRAFCRCSCWVFFCVWGGVFMEIYPGGREEPANPFGFGMLIHFPARGGAEHLQNSLIHETLCPILGPPAFPLSLFDLPTHDTLFFPLIKACPGDIHNATHRRNNPAAISAGRKTLILCQRIRKSLLLYISPKAYKNQCITSVHGSS